MTDPDPFSSGDLAGCLRRFRSDLLARVPAVRAPVRTSPGLDEGLRRNIAEDTFERRRVSTGWHLALVLVVGGLFWGKSPPKRWWSGWAPSRL